MAGQILKYTGGIISALAVEMNHTTNKSFFWGTTQIRYYLNDQHI